MIAGPSRKLLLINPANKARKGFITDPATRFMPLGLGIVAALTPSSWEVELLDESFEEFTFKPADLVGFTSFTASAPRVYELAKIYREKGIHTVMGGIHASMYTQEAVKYVDTVVTGEAEGAWPQLIKDFESGSIKSLYDGGIVDIHSIPHVRRDIYKYPYVYDSLQTSRGCPMGCDFCSVTHMCGKSYRERNVEDILDELEKTSKRLLFFVDDNMVNHKKGADERAIRLFKGMVSRGIKKYWTSQAALNFADNDELLYWARKSGCVMILMGIEAETDHALSSVRKNLNRKRGVESYEKVFRKMHRHGIGVLATIIFGLESDTREDLYARRDFIKNNSIDMHQCTILTPLPGTVLFDRMKEQDQIVLNNFPDDWQHFHFFISTVDTPKMKKDEIESSMHEIWLSLFNKEAMRKKMFRTLWNTKSLTTAYFAYAGNHSYGRMFLEGVFHTHPEGVDTNFEWKNRKRSLYLYFTDKILWLFYLISWRHIVKHFTGKY
jgi:radical SAM superfamily enzyme YgiQ (UPF0313 family)